MNVINNILPWDGTHLGCDLILTNQWVISGDLYYVLTDVNKNGLIYCTVHHIKDKFPCIVEDLKPLFNLPKRGYHIATLYGKEYILYYLPISSVGDVIWETPLSFIPVSDPIRKDEELADQIRKVFVFCNLLSLTSTGERSIKLRSVSENKYIPISSNELSTTITSKNKKKQSFDFCILNRTVFMRWFGEHANIEHIIAEMINGCYDDYESISVTISELKSNIDKVIQKHDSNYIWFSNFIINRVSGPLFELFEQ